MPSLTLIETEAQRLAGRIAESRRRPLQSALVELCEMHWQELRGAQPESLMARSLWSVTPPLSDLFVELYTTSDVRLDEALGRFGPAQGLAMLVMAEIERGNEAGVHIAQEAMMAFETAPPPLSWLERIAALSRGELEMPRLHHHDPHPPLWKALYVIVSHIKRFDLPAIRQAIQLLIQNPDLSPHTSLQELRADVAEVGIVFLDMDDDHIYIKQHGHEHKPVRARQLAEMLLEIRQAWLG